ncbi:VOC family protein [Streptomyces sp. NPDC059785]|uniref:VOC family protein n=1 Tax=unclassified Streptomyces TaxID=2593676 RepID=UPI0036507509
MPEEAEPGPVVRGIDHVGVTVPDIETATAFLVHALGAEVLYDTLRRADGPDSGAPMERRLGVPPGTEQRAVRMLALPHGPGLELFEYAGPRQEGPAVACDLGWQHLAVYVDDLGPAVTRVEEAGGHALSAPGPLPGPEAGERNRMVYTRTPWGSTLELISYPDRQPYEDRTARRRWRP